MFTFKTSSLATVIVAFSLITFIALFASFVLHWNKGFFWGPLCALTGWPLGPLLCLMLWIVLLAEFDWKTKRDEGWFLTGTIFGLAPLVVCIFAMMSSNNGGN